MKNSISFFVLFLLTLSFLSCGKEDLQPIAGDNFVDQTDIQDALADAPINGDNFYDQSDLQDVLANDKAIPGMNAMAQRTSGPASDQIPPEGITDADLAISRIHCEEGFRAGGLKLLVYDPRDPDMNKYNSREYRVSWTYSDGIAVSNFNGIATDCVCEGKIKVIVHEYATGASATKSLNLSGTCGLNERLPEIEAQRTRK